MLTKHNAMMTRRRFLAGAAAASAGLSLGTDGRLRPAQASGAFTLKAEETQVRLLPAPYDATSVWCFDGMVPGPEIRVRQGDTVSVSVENRLGDETTVHWHGLRVPNAMDGVAHLTQPPIAPGESFQYAFEAVDAGTFWYHPHHRSAEQVGRGLYGPLIVEERETTIFIQPGWTASLHENGSIIANKNIASKKKDN